MLKIASIFTGRPETDVWPKAIVEAVAKLDEKHLAFDISSIIAGIASRPVADNATYLQARETADRFVKSTVSVEQSASIRDGFCTATVPPYGLAYSSPLFADARREEGKLFNDEVDPDRNITGVQCKRCGQMTVAPETAQTKSGDEGGSAFMKCYRCGQIVTVS